MKIIKTDGDLNILLCLNRMYLSGVDVKVIADGNHFI